MDELLITSPELAPLAKEFLRDRGCTVRIVARGSSMRPFIRDGDTLTIVPSNGSDIRTGDVAFFERPDGSVAAHRALKRFERDGKVFLETRGDALSGVIERVEAGNILGKAVQAERGTRTVRLDSGICRGMAALWAACSPLSQVLLRIAHRLRIS